MSKSKSPSPDSGISDTKTSDNASTSPRPHQDSDSDSPIVVKRTRSSRRRLSSNSVVDEEESTPALDASPVRSRAASRRARARISDSSDAMEDATPSKKAAHSDDDDEPAANKRKSRKRGRADEGSDSEYEEEGAKSSRRRVKSTKDQLRRVRARRDVGGSSDEYEEEEEDDDAADPDELCLPDEDDDDHMPSNYAKAPKFRKPTRVEMKSRILEYFNLSLEDEMTRVKGISKRVFSIITEMRPFESYEDLTDRLDSTKGVNSNLVRAYMVSLEAEVELERVLSDCRRETTELRQAVDYLRREAANQRPENVAPTLLTNGETKLKPYQVLGVRWLHLMYGQRLNAILADEMGLGKTVQIVAFLALLKERRASTSSNLLHLIVVPSSTIDNWFTELHKWWPEVGVLNYYGGQEDRAFIRQDVLRRVRKARSAPAGEDMEDEDRPLDVLLTTYTMITSRPEDRAFLKKLSISHAIFDEAHMLKNCKTKRYRELTRIKAQRKILLTGTPLQNNLVELMSLMAFVMPALFKGRNDTTNDIFDMFQAREGTEYAAEKIRQAKEMLRPFVLRRLKAEVLTELPTKAEEVHRCPMTPYQQEVYDAKVDFFRKAKQADQESGTEKTAVGVIMQLRKAAQHPLLHRHHYSDEVLKDLSDTLCREESSLTDSEPTFVFQDLSVMSDFEIHKTVCGAYRSAASFALPQQRIFESGKMTQLDTLLPGLKADGKKALLFSQFVIVLDILEEYLRLRGMSFLRLDGSTPVVERQTLIDDFNNEPEISVFLLSTKAGGLGINLVSASTIILHDIDYNPYNDRQAEDRAHRLGQTATVRVVKLLSKDSIEERILDLATAKLSLEKQVTGREDVASGEEKDENVAQTHSIQAMLKAALKL